MVDFTKLLNKKTFDEKYMDTIKQMVKYIEDTKLVNIKLTVNFGGSDYNFTLEQIVDRFSEEHPYCKRECDYCSYGTHSQCEQPETCHDTDNKNHWVDLD